MFDFKFHEKKGTGCILFVNIMYNSFLQKKRPRGAIFSIEPRLARYSQILHVYDVTFAAFKQT